MYHWACRLGGKGWGWFTAWFNITGQLATLAAIDYGCALFVTPLAGLPATTGTVLLVYAGVLLSYALINHFGIRLVARLNDFSVTVHVVGVIAIVGAVFLFAPKQPIIQLAFRTPIWYVLGYAPRSCHRPRLPDCSNDSVSRCSARQTCRRR